MRTWARQAHYTHKLSRPDVEIDAKEIPLFGPIDHQLCVGFHLQKLGEFLPHSHKMDSHTVPQKLSAKMDPSQRSSRTNIHWVQPAQPTRRQSNSTKGQTWGRVDPPVWDAVPSQRHAVPLLTNTPPVRTSPRSAAITMAALMEIHAPAKVDSLRSLRPSHPESVGSHSSGSDSKKQGTVASSALKGAQDLRQYQ